MLSAARNSSAKPFHAEGGITNIRVVERVTTLADLSPDSVERIMPPPVVPAFAALETRRMLLTYRCQDDSVAPPITKSIPTTVCSGARGRVSGQSRGESGSHSQKRHRLT